MEYLDPQSLAEAHEMGIANRANDKEKDAIFAKRAVGWWSRQAELDSRNERKKRRKSKKDKN